MIHPKVEQHIPAIQALCEELGVTRLEMYEPQLTDSAGNEAPSGFIAAIRALCAESGVVRLETFDLPPGDEPALLVTFMTGDDGRGVRRLVELEERLATFLGRDVNLFTVSALRTSGSANRHG